MRAIGRFFTHVWIYFSGAVIGLALMIASPWTFPFGAIIYILLIVQLWYMITGRFPKA